VRRRADIKVTLLGASGGEVTGSAYLLQTARSSVLIDCGLFQGSKKLENSNQLPSQEKMRKLDAVVLTHAHLDHTGRLPLLTRFGYTGPIHATPATIELTDLILRDSAYLQSEEAKRQNRRRAEAGQPPIEPLYTQKQVDQLRPLYKQMRYDRPTNVTSDVTVRAVEAGHILGSASLEVTVNDNGRSKVLVFSGDLGPRGAPLHRDPVPFKRADVVFLESTYGDRDHPSPARSSCSTCWPARSSERRSNRSPSISIVPWRFVRPRFTARTRSCSTKRPSPCAKPATWSNSCARRECVRKLPNHWQSPRRPHHTSCWQARACAQEAASCITCRTTCRIQRRSSSWWDISRAAPWDGPWLTVQSLFVSRGELSRFAPERISSAG